MNIPIGSTYLYRNLMLNAVWPVIVIVKIIAGSTILFPAQRLPTHHQRAARFSTFRF